MMSGYIFVDNVDGDVYINRQVFWSREVAEEALEAWMSQQHEDLTKHKDGNYYDRNGNFVQAYVQEIDIPE